MSAVPQTGHYKRLSETTAPVPDWKALAAGAWEAPSWKEAAADYHKARDGRPSIVEINRVARAREGAAASTLEALMFGLRGGIDALPTKPERLRRLWELSETQLHEVCARLQNFQPTIARPWTADEVAALVKIWAKSHA
jgi:hypothetical protein